MVRSLSVGRVEPRRAESRRAGPSRAEPNRAERPRARPPLIQRRDAALGSARGRAQRLPLYGPCDPPPRLFYIPMLVTMYTYLESNIELCIWLRNSQCYELYFPFSTYFLNRRKDWSPNDPQLWKMNTHKNFFGKIKLIFIFETSERLWFGPTSSSRVKYSVRELVHILVPSRSGQVVARIAT